jgi:hypothetical protein
MSSDNHSVGQMLLNGSTLAAITNVLRGTCSTTIDLNEFVGQLSAGVSGWFAASRPNDKGRGSSRPYSSFMKE